MTRWRPHGSTHRNPQRHGKVHWAWQEKGKVIERAALAAVRARSSPNSLQRASSPVMPMPNSSTDTVFPSTTTDLEPAGLCEWGFERSESQQKRRDRIHGEVAAALKRRCQRLAGHQGRNQEVATQSAVIAEWLLADARTVEFMATLWVGRTGLPPACMRDYVARFAGACTDNIQAALTPQGLRLADHFAIWMVLEQSLGRSEAERRLHAHLLFAMTPQAIPHFRAWRGVNSKHANQLWREIVVDPAIWTRCTPSARIRSCRHDKRGAAGAILYTLKEIGHSDLTELEPVAPPAPVTQSGMVADCGNPEPERARRLRRGSRASGADVMRFRSVSADGQARVSTVARLRRRLCGLEVPESWREDGAEG